MVQESAQKMAYPRRLEHVKRLDIFFHGFKTLKLVGRLLGDGRVPLLRKVLFLGSIAGLLVLLLFPDALGEVVLSTIVPVIGTVAGVPIDAGFDWAAFALVVVSLLRFFPAEMVSEHYRSVFHK
ncbi:hypothetical protein [Tengunoibacter tsumagoiensis]|uniref:Uncharacterized protein n=1 Tax=Tengunoibacter tsumagoiensis TaxID=2014871 RepID=A0A401ZUZ0_9CHLR|nr:hypothetical protein [Tengunoibacter tsumagoiensis]GCE10550.1 hypothetical protein KTT_04090 [Tengunoibacter tsumagoiensis]